MFWYKLAGYLFIVFYLAALGFAVYFVLLLVKALRKYIHSKDIIEEKNDAEIFSRGAEGASNALQNDTRICFGGDRCKQTGSSKWENGSSDPSTSNLMALAKLYGVSTDELLKNISHGNENDKLTDKKTEEHQ